MKYTQTFLKTLMVFIGATLLAETLEAQNYFYKDQVVNWAAMYPLKIEAGGYSQDPDLVIIDDNSAISFGLSASYISRTQTFKINSEKGLKKFLQFKAPESFDLAWSDYHIKQGRKDINTGAYLDDFEMKKFSARVYSGNKWKLLPIDYKYEQRRWMTDEGEILKEETPVFKLKEIKVGDVVQVYYEASFVGNYGHNEFYFYSTYPKLQATIELYFEMPTMYDQFNFVKYLNLPDSAISAQSEVKDQIRKNTITVRQKNVQKINYPANAREADRLPHIYIELSFFRVLKDTYVDNGLRVNSFAYRRAQNFEWLNISDTSSQYEKVYIKHYAAVRKFASRFPPLRRDTVNLPFLKAFSDSINAYRFITQDQIFYNESNLRDVSFMDHVARRRIPQNSGRLLYDLLWENGIFYYVADVMDRRYGGHSLAYRVHRAYERNFFVLPEGDRFNFLLCRPGGMTFHVNELPFYLEGSVAALFPRNFQAQDSVKLKKYSKFIRTHEGTANENTRTENATIKINTEQQVANYTSKLSLSGQYSTILRPLYLKQAIDSTLSAHYFKKCTDKPGAKDASCKLSSNIKEYPFRYTFNCSENLQATKYALSLKNWFSFPLNTEVLPEAPTHDFYFDFVLSDVYNFLFEFDKPAKLINQVQFKKQTSGPYFDLDSEILQQSETTYLLKVKVQIKDHFIPLSEMHQLTQLVKDLDQLNDLRLEWE